jgi:type I restriction enzyme S subunit
MSNTIPFSNLVHVNPGLGVTLPSSGTQVSFITMADVSEDGHWTSKKTRDVSSVISGFTSFAEDDVLFAKITPCMENGKGCHAKGLKNGIGFGSTEFIILRARGENNSRFIYHWTRSPSLRQSAENLMTGSAGQQRVSPDFFQEYKVADISPAEQNSIVGVLDKLDDLIRLKQSEIEKIRKIKVGMLNDLLSCGLDENGELRNPKKNPDHFKNTEIGLIPKEWDVVPLKAIGEIKSGGTPARSVPTFWGGNIPWATPTDLTSLKGKYLRSTKEFITNQGLIGSAATLLPIGSLLVTTRATIGAIAIAGNPVTTNQGFKSIIPGADADSEFYYYCLHMVIPAMRRLAIGSTFMEISKTDFEMIKIQQPRKHEQIEIAKILKNIDETIRLKTGLYEKYKKIKTGLMHDVLTGLRRVPIKKNGGSNG